MPISKFYLHDAASSVGGTLPTVKQSTYSVDATATGANTNRLADGTIGLSQVASPTASAVGGGQAQVFSRRFMSAPINAQTITGTATFAGAAIQDNAGPGAAPQEHFYLGLWRPSAGTLIGHLFNTAYNGWQGGAAITEQAGTTTAKTLTSQTAVDGDVILVEIFSGYSFSGSANCGCFYDGTVEGSVTTNASYILFSNAIGMVGDAPPILLDSPTFSRKGMI